MELERARERKAELLGIAAQAMSQARALNATDAAEFAIGIAPRELKGATDYGIAVRYRDSWSCRSALEALNVEAAGDLDVRETGEIRAFSVPVAPADLQRKVRPLRPRLSIGHPNVTAGTLGAFVTDPQGTLFALSNWHVLVGSPGALEGDAILQPGVADEGSPEDQVGILAAHSGLARGQAATVDAALARLDEDVQAEYPIGPVTSHAVAAGGEYVGKIGRTTAITRGRISAIELDDVSVDFGDAVGVLTFDDQLEIEGINGEFSAPGDSGSLIYTESGVAVGLLFAGSEQGGSGGTGLTYANPISGVLETFGVQLSGSSPSP